jgi:hypothetical protein
MEKFTGTLLALLGFLTLLVGLGFLMTYPTKWLVNYLFSNTFLFFVFGVSKLTFWKAWALNAVCGTLIKSTNTTSTK